MIWIPQDHQTGLSALILSAVTPKAAGGIEHRATTLAIMVLVQVHYPVPLKARVGGQTSRTDSFGDERMLIDHRNVSLVKS